MADNTQVQANQTGDTLRTEAATEDDGSVVKTVVTRPAFGPPHMPPTLVSETSPLPVTDRAVYNLLTEIRDLLQEILEEVRG